ncbi:hypothetical protein EB796_004929 [Bugula neritina]|uniref:Uncharacterized protein n=1 Tax=Bugula neritina TaxID=10212 RepID=A0A7J7KDN7_BUGNE|nr:hypothetical protein EB796_004929 [Bugula neritina]
MGDPVEKLNKNTFSEDVQDRNSGDSSDMIQRSNDSIPPNKVPKLSGSSWVQSYRRVIAILPGSGKKGTLTNDVESSDDDESDTRSEGVIETSSSSSGIEEGIPFPQSLRL